MDEKKEYSVVGTVTIGTDEYRDLIEAKFTAEREYNDCRDKYWAELSEKRKLQDKVSALTAKVEKYETFIKKNSASFINEEGINLLLDSVNN